MSRSAKKEREFVTKNKEVIIVQGKFYRVLVTRYLNKSGLLHRDKDDPAYIAKVGNKILVEEWYQNNKLYRKGKPARKEYFKL
jgi:hypothetical protein